jgi:hypothetical protein
VKAFQPLWVAFKAAVLATAVFAVVLFVINHAGWKGLIFAGLDMTTYIVFFVVFFLGLFMAPRS